MKWEKWEGSIEETALRLRGDGFDIGYARQYPVGDGIVTALIVEAPGTPYGQQIAILKGDFREEFEFVLEAGLDAAKDVIRVHKDVLILEGSDLIVDD